jgi:hypothetical protein
VAPVALGAVVAGDVADVPECVGDDDVPLEPVDVDATGRFASAEQAALNRVGAASAEAAVAALRRKLRREADCVRSSGP